MADPLKWMKVPASISERIGEAGALVDSTEGNVRILSHYDGDGINSAGIISRAVHRCGKSFHATMMNVMRKKDLDELDGGFELLIVSDMGSSQAEMISERIIDIGARGIILDHHKVNGRDRPFSISDGGGIIEVNPRFYGINGTSGCSGSTLSFLLALALDPGNVDLCIYSLAGSLADRQHVPEYSDLNKGVRDLAVDRGYLRSMTGMPFSGRSILESLITSNDPFIRGISGNKKGSMSLLEDLGIEPDIPIADLTGEQTKKLYSYVYVHLLKDGVAQPIVRELFREVLHSDEWGDLQDLAYTIDTCGRRGLPGKGLEVVWGSRSTFEEAREERFEQKKVVQSLLLKAMDEGVNDMENIQWMIVEVDKLAGTVGGLGHNYLFDHDKPMIAISEGEDDTMKVSSRGHKALCDKGLDLGTVMARASAENGGDGGGHDVAAGGSFRKENMESFLAQCDRMVGEQMSGGK